MKAIISYENYLDRCDNSDNDVAYTIAVLNTSNTTAGITGNYQDIQDLVPSNKVSHSQGQLKFVMAFDNTWSPTDYPEPLSSFNQALVVGILAHSKTPTTTTLQVKWYRKQDNINPYKTKTVSFLEDYYLDKHFPRNSIFVFDEDELNLINQTITKVEVIISTDQNDSFSVGRLWIGNKFVMKADVSQSACFDAGWSMTYVSDGRVDRNVDKTAGYPQVYPVQRLLSVTKSSMDYEMAYGDLTGQTSQAPADANTKNHTVAKMAMTAPKSKDILVIPKSEDATAMKLTAVWGTVQNNIRIQKNSSNNLYSFSIDVLELVDEPDGY